MLVAAAGASFALALNACGGDDEPAAPARPPTTAAPATVTAKAPPAPTAKPKTSKPTRSDAEIAASRNFFLAIDDDALALDDAIGTAIDGVLEGDRSGAAAIKRARARIADRDYKRVVAGGDVSPGVEALKAAAADAETAAVSGTPRQLVLARVAAQDARQQVTSEFVSP